jgi:predicted NBD/HSP70 family sugar kinase
MAVPGIVSWPDGASRFSPNFGWRDVPVRALMEERLGLPVLVDNEVRALALAEHEFGAAKRARTAVFLDLGYGLGGAVIIDGSLYRGAHGGAGEIGHNTVDPGGPLCSCGNRGCLEVFASESGLLARAHEALAAGRDSSLSTIPEGRLALSHLLDAARTGDSLAHDLIRQAATYLGLVVANAIDNWDPEVVVLSGPVMDAGGALLDELLRTEQRTVLETARNRVRVVRAQLGAGAKIIGAAHAVVADYLAAPLHSRQGQRV